VDVVFGGNPPESLKPGPVDQQPIVATAVDAFASHMAERTAPPQAQTIGDTPSLSYQSKEDKGDAAAFAGLADPLAAGLWQVP
jgi:hypothetical protein